MNAKSRKIFIALWLVTGVPLTSTNAQENPSQPDQAATSKNQETIKIMRSRSQPSRQGPAENFTGSVRVDPLFEMHPPGRASGSLVTFEPGARTGWHTHPLGQILIVMAGAGRVQRWGDR